MVADAKQCSEGVSFFHVRRLILVDVPLSCSEYQQRVGRAVRFNGHKDLDEEDKTVEVTLTLTTHFPRSPSHLPSP